ncbi:uncharacterized protein LOC110441502 isoform X2 [Mizuhopecten yessoensis]|uniref:uncharacterized protein LOC110441502 isoform X2 n=1 Tax=Mizuhopecten yessoensis TaxID=6573 RepID=UPI000B45F489|nr:uncharacterized protein LOC110441502 isoform X2 [Mizuhopecten yessoensis]
MEKKQRQKAYKKPCHNPTCNVSKRKEKMKNKNTTKAKSHEMSDELYKMEMRDYIEMLNSCPKEKKYTDRPKIKMLIYASQHNKRKDLEYLYSRKKLNVNLKILLKHAIFRDHEDLGVWFLQKIKYGAKFENFRNSPLLHVAVNKGFANVVTVLLEQHSVDVNARDGNGETALHLASRKDNEHPTICRILLEHGARTDISDRNGILPLHRLSRDSYSTKMIDLLLEFKADIEALDRYGKRPLEYAFDRKFNKQTVVCHLIRQGAKIKPILREIRNRSPKANVNDMSVLDCVDLTGDVGALVDLLKEDGDTSTLCKSNKDATVKRLLRYVKLTGSHRLRRCLQERSLSIEDKSPSDVQRQCNFESEAVYKQGQSEQRVVILHFEAVDRREFLLAIGGDELTNKLHVNPDAIDVVVVVSPSNDEESIQKVFTLAAQHLINAAHGIPGEDPLKFIHIHTSKFLADTSLPYIIRSDLQCSKLSGKRLPYDCLPMHHEILHKRSDALQNMLNRGIEDVNAEDEAGWTALHLAILLGETKIVKMLLDHGANAASRPTHYLPAFVYTEWKGKSRMTLSPLTLSVRLNLKEIVQVLTERNPGYPSMDTCIKLSYGMKTESALLESVCREAERRHKDVGARFEPTYTVHKNLPIERVCLGCSEDVDEIEKKEDIHGVSVVIINTDISPESNWIETTEMTKDEEDKCKSVIDLWADYLWDQHPNLNAITAGSLTSVKCPEAKPTGHIILHCSHKGYVPHESNCFPTELKCEKGTMPVAVLEGEFSLSPLPLVTDHGNSKSLPGVSGLTPSDNDGHSNSSQVVSGLTPSEYDGHSNSSQVVSGVIPSENDGHSNSSQVVSGLTPSDNDGHLNSSQVVSGVIPSEHDGHSNSSPGVSGVIPSENDGHTKSSPGVSGVIPSKAYQGEQDATTCVCAASASSKKATKRNPMKTDEHLSLKLGMHLCKSQSIAITAYVGTVGSFVEMGNGKTGFITCAHLFYNQAISEGKQPIHFSCSQERCGADVIAPFDHFSEKVLRGVTYMEIDDDPVCKDDDDDENGRNVYWECGKVVRARFDSTLETGIDAAIVEIDKDRAPCDGSFDDIKHIHLRNAKMDWKHPPTFTSGKQADASYLDAMSSSERPIRCMKLGASSGLSVGILTWKHGQIRLPDSPRLGIERDSLNKYVMKGQFVISEYNRKQFFECGDSGSAVFVMKRDAQHYYPDACLGIAIGFLDKKTFVTPIGSILDILKADNLPELALKKFK